MTINFTLRLPPDLADLLDQASREAATSRHQFILDVLTEVVSDGPTPGIVLGYVEVAGGELDTAADCPQCLQPYADKGVFIGFLAGAVRPRPFGPVCGWCATSE
jgi:hypothetical protein